MSVQTPAKKSKKTSYPKMLREFCRALRAGNQRTVSLEAAVPLTRVRIGREVCRTQERQGAGDVLERLEQLGVERRCGADREASGKRVRIGHVAHLVQGGRI